MVLTYDRRDLPDPRPPGRKSSAGRSWSTAGSLFLIPLCTGVYISIYRIHLVNAPIYLALGMGFRGWWRPLGWVVVGIWALLECSEMFAWVVGLFRP